MTRAIATVVRRARLGAIDGDADRRAYWASKSAALRIAEIEDLRRVWRTLTGDPDAPFVRVVQRRRLR